MQHTEYYQDYSLHVQQNDMIFKDESLNQVIATLKNGKWYYKDQGYQNQPTPVVKLRDYLNDKEIHALETLLKLPLL